LSFFDQILAFFTVQQSHLQNLCGFLQCKSSRRLFSFTFEPTLSSKQKTIFPMKTISTFFFFLLFCSPFGWAQPHLPAKPEDISPLLIGEKVPAASLLNAKGEKVDLLALMAAKPTVLIFYRGGWCPYCNQHLSQIGEAEAKILAMGYQIIAISPDQPAKLLETSGKQKLSYTLLSDSSSTLSKAMGLAYQAPNHYLKIISEASNGVNKESLPVPALFLIITYGEIEFEYIQPNFKIRMSSKMLLAVLASVR